MHEVLNIVAVDFVHVIPDLDPLNIRLAVGIQLQHTAKTYGEYTNQTGMLRVPES